MDEQERSLLCGDVMAIGDAMMLKICCNGAFLLTHLCESRAQLLIDGELIDVVKWLSGSDVID
jgi:hypothetical protein